MSASEARKNAGHNSNGLSFERLHISPNGTEARLGRLHFRNRTPIDTPNYIGISSRGAVPHLTQDMMRDHTSIKGLYAALEDCEYSMDKDKMVNALDVD